MSQASTRGAEMNALIRPLRSLCGLTQEQFAARLGVTVVTVNRWENKRTQPMPLAIRQIKALLLEISQSAREVDQAAAHCFLEQYFPKTY